MITTQQLHQQILQAIIASEEIIVSLQSGNLKEAEKLDGKRAHLVRVISKCQNFETMAISCMAEIKKLTELDKKILQYSQKLRDEVLTQIRQGQSNRLRHAQYAQNQQLPVEY